jgi:hypothetical protein
MKTKKEKFVLKNAILTTKRDVKAVIGRIGPNLLKKQF